MSETNEERASTLRGVRAAYDRAAPGDRAVLRRCRSPGELLLEGAYWRLVADLDEGDRRRLAQVVYLYPACGATTRAGFSLGAHLRRGLGVKTTVDPGAALRFRRLIEARDDDAVFLHHLRRLLTQIAAPVDWGALGADLLDRQRSGWSAENVARRWSQDFYAPLPKRAGADPSTAAGAKPGTEAES